MSIFSAKAIGEISGPDTEELRRALKTFPDPEQGFLLFSFAPVRHFCRPGHTMEELLSCSKQLESAIESLDWEHNPPEKGAGVLWRLNPVAPTHGNKSSNVGDHTRRRWLLIDIDPIKPAEHHNNPATDEEQQNAAQVMAEVIDYLTGVGWPEPVVVDSGNGFHILYRIDLENNEEVRQLLKRFLTVIADSCSSELGKVERTTYAATQNSRLPGHKNRKGTESPDRPYRMVRIHSAPEEPRIVTAEQLAAIAGPAEPKPKPSPSPPSSGSIFEGRAAPAGPSAYAKSALERELGKVAMAPLGSREKTLWDAACALGNFVASGELDESSTFEQLVEAAMKAGLPKEEARDKARRGLDTGKTTPRQTPSTPQPSTNGKHEKPKHQTQPTIVTLSELMAMELPSPNWAIPGLLSEGLSILAGKPKLGKSWMAFNLAITIAAGGSALGMARVVPGDVLYLSLEDRLRRVQDRGRKLLNGMNCSATNRLYISTEWPKQNQGGLDHIARWMRSVERPTMVIIDVWSKFRSVSSSRQYAYDQDFAIASEVKAVADDHHCNVLALHHTKKMAAEDAVDEVSGTLGFAGCADSILVLTRSRNETEGTLFMTSRDTEERKMAVEFDTETFVWKSLGDADERESVVTSKLIRKVLTNASGPLYAREVFDRIELHGINYEATRKCLQRMVAKGEATKSGQKFSIEQDEAAF